MGLSVNFQYFHRAYQSEQVKQFECKMNFLKLSSFLTVILMCMLLQPTEARYHDLAAKLANALNDPQNDAKFNEIPVSEEDDPVDPVIFLYYPDDETTEKQAIPAPQAIISSTTQKSVLESESDGEARQRSAGALKRRVQDFLGTLMQIRQLFHLNN